MKKLTEIFSLRGCVMFHFAFWLFFVLGFCANISKSVIEGSVASWLLTPLVTAFLAGAMALPTLISKSKAYKRVYIVAVSVLLTLLIAMEFFLMTEFSIFCGQDVIDILYETNGDESSEFLATYMSFGKIVLYVIGMVTVWALSFLLAKYIVQRRYAVYAERLLAGGGVIVMAVCGIGFIKYRNGMSIPQYSSPTRILYSMYVADRRAETNRELCGECASYIQTAGEKSRNRGLNVILVIGESHSYYHTPAYGYGINTFPLVGSIADSTLVWYDDIVTVSDHTQGAMDAIFPMNIPEGPTVLFPAVFKALGYKTAMYDNQYLAGNGISILSDGGISDLLYDVRNKTRVPDLELVRNGIAPDSANTMVIYHLMGSHYKYEERYPRDKFSVFGPDDYPGHGRDEAEILAHYDNSLRYTDYVLKSVMDKYADKNSVMVYISDHGEEVFDIDGYMGHGNAYSRSRPEYQIRVPMFIWMSEGYMASYPDKRDAIRRNSGNPGLTSGIGHLLLDIANEAESRYRPQRSIVHGSYEKPRRVVLNSLDFDEACAKK